MFRAAQGAAHAGPRLPSAPTLPAMGSSAHPLESGAEVVAEGSPRQDPLPSPPVHRARTLVEFPGSGGHPGGAPRGLLGTARRSRSQSGHGDMSACRTPRCGRPRRPWQARGWADPCPRRRSSSPRSVAPGPPPRMREPPSRSRRPRAQRPSNARAACEGPRPRTPATSAHAHDPLRRREALADHAHEVDARVGARAAALERAVPRERLEPRGQALVA